MDLEEIKRKMVNDKRNEEFTKKGYLPLFQVNPKAKILLIGQAPGKKAMESGVLFSDASGDNLRAWMG